MKKITITNWKLTLCFIGLYLSLSNALIAQDPSLNCVAGCTSNDIRIKTAYLVDAVTLQPLAQNLPCNFGDNVSVKLALDLETNTPRVGVYIFANVKNNTTNSLIADVSECFSTPLASAGVTKVVFSEVIVWSCGTPIKLTDVFIGWGTGNTDFCMGSSAPRCPATKSKCFSLPPGEYIPVITYPCTPASAGAVSNTTVCVSASASFSSTFTAAANTQVTTIQWQVDKNDGNGFVNIPAGSPYTVTSSVLPANSGTTTLDITPLSTTLNGYKYRASFGSTSSSGATCDGTSSSGTLNVTAASVGGSLTASQTICTGTQPANLTLSGQTGNILRYEWATDAAFTTPNTIANTSATLTSALMGNLTADRWFRAVVQNSPCASTTSSSVKITITSLSVGGSLTANQTICTGTQPANLSLSGQTGNIVRYEWATDAAFTSPNTISSTSATLTSALMGNLTVDRWFRAVVQNSPCASTTSSSIKITITSASVGGAVTPNQTICTGSQPADLSLSGQNGNILRWEWATDAAFTTPNTIANTTATLTSAQMGALTADRWFRAVVQNSPCASTASSSAKITVSSIPGAPQVTYVGPTCLETTFKVTVDNPHNGSTYTLRQLSGGVGPVTKTAPADVVGGKIEFSGLTVGKGYRVTETNAAGCISAPEACGDFSSITGAARAPSQTMVGEETQATTVKAYPNPFNEKVKFIVTSPASGDGSLEIYNMMGQKIKTVYSGHFNAGSQNFELSLPTKQVTTLVYVLRIGGKQVTGKLVQNN